MEIGEVRMTEAEIVYLPIAKLTPHPDNPRKNLGDLSELVESVKARGVLQNLTVVPYYSPIYKRVMDDIYTVIIGHRRLAAARQAGLEKVPCVIADMTPEEQIATMLMENIQRSALTPYEEAKGFEQLQIDFGKSTQEIAEMSGFHESTVRNRLKLAKLDGEKVQKGIQRGATLFDFAELDKVEDASAREKCLDAIGTNNFKNTLKRELDEQNFRHNFQEFLETVRSFASEIFKPKYTMNGDDGPGYYSDTLPGMPLDFIMDIDRYTKTVTKPDDADSVKYYFYTTERNISLYRVHITDAAAEETKKQEDMERKKWQNRMKQIKAVSQRHYELRRDFIRDFGAAKSHLDSIVRSAPYILYLSSQRSVWNHETRMNNGLTFLLAQGKKGESMTTKIRNNAIKMPEKTLLNMLSALADEPELSYFSEEWITVSGSVDHYEPHYKKNPLLDEIYYLLMELGYQISDEEQQMRHGTHPLFVPENS